MRLSDLKKLSMGMMGMLLLVGVTAGCGPSKAEKELAARMEAAASKAEAAANKAEAAARSAADAAQRAEAAASKAEAIFQKGMRK
jgi:hypothetical protein